MRKIYRKINGLTQVKRMRKRAKQLLFSKPNNMVNACSSISIVFPWLFFIFQTNKNCQFLAQLDLATERIAH